MNYKKLQLFFFVLLTYKTEAALFSFLKKNKKIPQKNEKTPTNQEIYEKYSKEILTMNNHNDILILYTNFKKQILDLVFNKKYEFFKENQNISNNLVKEFIINNSFFYVFHINDNKLLENNMIKFLQERFEENNIEIIGENILQPIEKLERGDYISYNFFTSKNNNLFKIEEKIIYLNLPEYNNFKIVPMFNLSKPSIGDLLYNDFIVVNINEAIYPHIKKNSSIDINGVKETVFKKFKEIANLNKLFQKAMDDFLKNLTFEEFYEIGDMEYKINYMAVVINSYISILDKDNLKKNKDNLEFILADFEVFLEDIKNSEDFKNLKEESQKYILNKITLHTEDINKILETKKNKSELYQVKIKEEKQNERLSQSFNTYQTDHKKNPEIFENIKNNGLKIENEKISFVPEIKKEAPKTNKKEETEPEAFNNIKDNNELIIEEEKFNSSRKIVTGKAPEVVKRKEIQPEAFNNIKDNNELKIKDEASDLSNKIVTGKAPKVIKREEIKPETFNNIKNNNELIIEEEKFSSSRKIVTGKAPKIIKKEESEPEAFNNIKDNNELTIEEEKFSSSRKIVTKKAPKIIGKEKIESEIFKNIEGNNKLKIKDEASDLSNKIVTGKAPKVIKREEIKPETFNNIEDNNELIIEERTPNLSNKIVTGKAPEVVKKEIIEPEAFKNIKNNNELIIEERTPDLSNKIATEAVPKVIAETSDKNTTLFERFKNNIKKFFNPNEKIQTEESKKIDNNSVLIKGRIIDDKNKENIPNKEEIKPTQSQEKKIPIENVKNTLEVISENKNIEPVNIPQQLQLTSVPQEQQPQSNIIQNMAPTIITQIEPIIIYKQPKYEIVELGTDIRSLPPSRFLEEEIIVAETPTVEFENFKDGANRMSIPPLEIPFQEILQAPITNNEMPYVNIGNPIIMPTQITPIIRPQEFYEVPTIQPLIPLTIPTSPNFVYTQEQTPLNLMENTYNSEIPQKEIMLEEHYFPLEENQNQRNLKEKSTNNEIYISTDVLMPEENNENGLENNERNFNKNYAPIIPLLAMPLAYMNFGSSAA